MPGKYAWICLNEGLTLAMLEDKLDEMKTYKVHTSQLIRCTKCTVNLDDHKMRYRILNCKSGECHESCEWHVRTLMCEKTEVVTLFQSRQHTTQVRSPPRKNVSLAAKRIIKDMTRIGARPGKIQTELVSQGQSDTHQRPTLCQIQRVAYHYRKTVLLEVTFVATMNQAIDENRLFESSQSMTHPFAFGYDIDSLGRANIGNGSDSAPAFVGVTTIALLSQLSWALHVDATFKLNQSGYPVIIFGVSDMARTFHPVASFISSQLT